MFLEKSITGQLFYIPMLNEQPSFKISIAEFNERYNKLTQQLEDNTSRFSIVDDIRLGYVAILKDASFKENLLPFIHEYDELSTALIAFYEHKILPVFNSRVSKEIFNLLQLLHQDEKAPFQIQNPIIVFARDINIFTWMTLDLSLVEGFVFIDLDPDAHACQIAQSLELPFIIQDENVLEKYSIGENENMFEVTITKESDLTVERIFA